MTDFQQILEECLARVANGTSTVDECLARYPEHAMQLRPLLRTVLFLNLRPSKNPVPVSEAPSRLSFFTQLLRSPLLQPRTMPMAWRVSFTLAMLVMALLVSGTARAQSALPGDPFYNWKRASEEVWRAVSTDPVATDLALSERRLNEWIAVANDPARRDVAMDEYFESLDRLKAIENPQNVARILPVLQSHHDKLNKLNDDNYSSDEVDNVVAEVQHSPIAEVTQPPSNTTNNADKHEPAPTDGPQPIEPAPTNDIKPPAIVPTEPPPTVAVPTEPPPTVVVPTEPPPTVVVPTEPPPTVVVPTEPPSTVIPTEAPPTDVPTEAPPTESTAPTDVPTNDVLEVPVPLPTLPAP